MKDPDEGPRALPARYAWAPAGRHVELTLGTSIPYPLGNETEIRVQRHPMGWQVNERLYTLDLRSVNYKMPLPALERDAAERAPCLAWAGYTSELPSAVAIIRKLPHRCVGLWLRETPEDATAPPVSGSKDLPWYRALLSIADRVVALRVESSSLKLPFKKLARLMILHPGGCAVPSARELPLLEQIAFQDQMEFGQCAVTSAVERLARRPQVWRITGLVSSSVQTQRLLQKLSVESLGLKVAEWEPPGEGDAAPRSRKRPPLVLPPSLRELSFSQDLNLHQKATFEWLSGVPQLRILSTLHCPSSKALSALPGLEVLRLHRCPIPEKLPALRALWLDWAEKIIAPQLTTLAGAAPALRELDLELYDALDAKQIAPLVRLKKTLRRLRVRSQRDATGDLGEVLQQLSELRELELGLILARSGFKSPWSRLPELRYLNLRKAEVPAGGVLGLGALSKLRELRIDGAQASRREFADIGRLRELRVLTLKGAAVDDDLASQLGQLRNLQRLDLSETAVGETNLQWLTNLTELRYLDMSGTLATDVALAPSVKGLPRLVELHLDGTNISRATLASLSSMRSLRTVSVGHTNIEAGAVFEARLPRNLAILRLPYTRANGRDLAALERLQRLRELDLRATGLIDEHLARLPHLGELRKLVLGQNRISTAVIEKIRKQNPAANVSCVPCDADRWVFERAASTPPTGP